MSPTFPTTRWKTSSCLTPPPARPTEIAVIAVKDPADVTKAADSLRAHVESRRKLFLQYGPAEAARVEKAQVFTKDQYAVLIICDDSPAVKTAFDDFLPSSDTGSD